MIRFHVIYTPGTTAMLLPLAWSLLRAPEGRFVLVDNGCESGESQRIRAVADSEKRFSYYRLPYDGLVRHGIALAHLLEQTNDPQFAIIDSDMMASGDFMADLNDPPDDWGAICAGWPVWIEDGEATCDGSHAFVGGPYRRLPDGTNTGGTFCAIYNREALQSALAQVPNGPADQNVDELPAALRSAFAERGWEFARFGTMRAAMLQMLLQGRAILNRESHHLHHIGDVSHIGDIKPGSFTRRLRRSASLLLRGQRHPVTNFSVNVLHRMSRRGRARARLYQRKTRVVKYLTALMIALRDGRPAPTPLASGSDEVDARVRRLTQILHADYPGYCQRLREIAPE